MKKIPINVHFKVWWFSYIFIQSFFPQEPFKPLFSNITVYRFLNVFNLSWCYIVEKYDKSNKALEFLDFHFDNVLSWFFCIWHMADRPEILNLTEIIWTIDCQHASESLLWTLFKKVDWLLNSYKPMSKTMLYNRYISLFPTVLYLVICLSNKVIHTIKKEMNTVWF